MIIVGVALLSFIVFAEYARLTKAGGGAQFFIGLLGALSVGLITAGVIYK